MGDAVFRELSSWDVKVEGFISAQDCKSRNLFNCEIFRVEELISRCLRQTSSRSSCPYERGVIFLGSSFRDEIQLIYEGSGLSNFFLLDDFFVNQKNYYFDWYREHALKLRKSRLLSKRLDNNAVQFSVVIPIFQPDPSHFRECLDSLSKHRHENLEIIFVFDGPLSYSALIYSLIYEKIPKARICELEVQSGISSALNFGISQAVGEFVCFLDQDDAIEADVFDHYALAVNNYPDTNIIYCDEDKINEFGEFCNPYFKGAFDFLLLIQQNYLCHFLCIRRKVLSLLGGFDSACDGFQDHDLILRYVCAIGSVGVRHVPFVLYHWRISNSSTAKSVHNKPGVGLRFPRRCVQHLESFGITSRHVSIDSGYWQYSAFPLRDIGKISVVVLAQSVDQLTESFFDSVCHGNSYSNIELIIGCPSCDDLNFHATQIRSLRIDFRWVEFEEKTPFRTLKSNILASVTGDTLFFLSPNMRFSPRCSNILTHMASMLELPSVAAVGPKILYSDDLTVMHAGLLACDDGQITYRDHLSKDTDTGYFYSRRSNHLTTVLSLDCLMTTKDVLRGVSLDDPYWSERSISTWFCQDLLSRGYHLCQASSVWLNMNSKPIWDQREARELSPTHCNPRKIESVLEHHEGIVDPFYSPNLSIKYPYRFKVPSILEPQ